VGIGKLDKKGVISCGLAGFALHLCDKSHCAFENSALLCCALTGQDGLTVGLTNERRGDSCLSISVYFGVDCRRCDNRIPLVEVISGPRIYQWFVPRVPPFEVQCDKCGCSRTYRDRHVIVFESPTIDNFETHPAFDNV